AASTLRGCGSAGGRRAAGCTRSARRGGVARERQGRAALRAAGHRERVGDAPIATTRRVVRQRLGAALALGALPRCADAEAWTRPPPPGPDLGIQLYTLRSVLPQDFDGTLARLADVGYREVEFAGYHGRDPAAVRAALDAAGLRAPSAHVAIEALDAEWARTLEAAHAIGHEWLVVAWIPEELRPDLDGYRRIAERFN